MSVLPPSWGDKRGASVPVTFLTSSLRPFAALSTPFQSFPSTTIVAVLPSLAIHNRSLCAVAANVASIAQKTMIIRFIFVVILIRPILLQRYGKCNKTHAGFCCIEIKKCCNWRLRKRKRLLLCFLFILFQHFFQSVQLFKHFVIIISSHSVNEYAINKAHANNAA